MEGVASSAINHGCIRVTPLAHGGVVIPHDVLGHFVHIVYASVHLVGLLHRAYILWGKKAKKVARGQLIHLRQMQRSYL